MTYNHSFCHGKGYHGTDRTFGLAFGGLTDSVHTVLCRFINNPTMAIYCHFFDSYFVMAGNIGHICGSV